MNSREARRRAWRLATPGALALVAGLLLYLTSRDPSRAMLVPAVASLAGHPLPGPLAGWLPSFVHPFAFILFTAALLAPGATGRLVACTAWCAVDLVFELGQHAVFKNAWADALRTAAGDSLPLRPVLRYLLQGTFDVGDLAAIVLGTLAAAGVLRLVDRPLETPHASR